MTRRDFLTIALSSPLLSKKLLASSTENFYFTKEKWKTFLLLQHRLNILKHYVGYANFNILSFDEALYYARNYSQIGEFTKEELALVEEFFYLNPTIFGFYGKKTVATFSNTISQNDIIKIPHSGHFLFKGKAYNDFLRLKKDIGDDLILTSGIRNVIKQLNLYCNKIYNFNGNINEASKNIAPPAYSYHSISDFDVGKKGWGYKNFSTDFAQTEEFKKISQLNYISNRYIPNNKDGVRYEPWHIKVI